MSTLLLRLAAPMQSWGLDAKFDRRGTERTPTKSGVIGLVAAAMGRRRNESVEDLQMLRFGARVERAGTLLRDYHTAKSEKAAYVTQRYYLSDAVFLAGLEGDISLLTEIDYALSHPVFPLFLGRRSCPPEGRLSLGIREDKILSEALREEPWLIDEWRRSKWTHTISLPMTMDADDKDTNVIFSRDMPISFDQKHRQFGFRRVSVETSYLIPNTYSHHVDAENQTNHDPMKELED